MAFDGDAAGYCMSMRSPSQTVSDAALKAEEERIARVYKAYEESPAKAADWSLQNPGNRRMVEEGMAWLKRQLSDSGRLPLAGRRVLEVGCSQGDMLLRMLEFGAQPENLFGVDVLAERIAEANHACPAANFSYGNAAALPFDDAQFDVILVFKLFSSILDEGIASAVAAEINRVLAPDGVVLWWDMRYPNPWNPNVRPVSRAKLRGYFPHFDLKLTSATLLPPLARRFGRFTSAMYPVFCALPCLRSHWIGILSKRPRQAIGGKNS